jgi:hypothetical protein
VLLGVFSCARAAGGGWGGGGGGRRPGGRKGFAVGVVYRVIA